MYKKRPQKRPRETAARDRLKINNFVWDLAGLKRASQSDVALKSIPKGAPQLISRSAISNKSSNKYTLFRVRHKRHNTLVSDSEQGVFDIAFPTPPPVTRTKFLPPARLLCEQTSLFTPQQLPQKPKRQMATPEAPESYVAYDALA